MILQPVALLFPFVVSHVAAAAIPSSSASVSSSAPDAHHTQPASSSHNPASNITVHTHSDVPSHNHVYYTQAYRVVAAPSPVDP